MNNDFTIVELIKKRTSWRSYDNLGMDEEAEKDLRKFISNPGEPPFGSKTSFHLIEAKAPERGSVPGTYGVIKGANRFIVGTVERGENDLEDYGYQFEKIILFATQLDLGTCWMGGTFKRTSYAEKVSLKKGYALPAISPVGPRTQKRSTLDKAMRFSAGSKKRKSWSDMFFDRAFGKPLSRDDAGQFAVPLEMVRLGPSASNGQSWRIIKQDERFHFFGRQTKSLLKTYKRAFGVDLQRIDIGIAMCHFEMTAHEMGINGNWCKMDHGQDSLPSGTQYFASWETQK